MTPSPRLVAFDLDDTLAPSKSPLDDRMIADLLALLERTQVCVISGGRFAQFEAQIIERLVDATDAQLARLHLMPTCGTQYFRHQDDAWQEIYAQNLTADEKSRALLALEEEARALGLWESETWGPVLEDRGSQITFSALGQAAPVPVKVAWDPDSAKKSELRARVADRLPDLEVRSGGSTSIDVTRQGIDKAYGMTQLAELTGIPFDSMLFVGDRLDPDGNDYPVLALGVPCHAVTGWQDTAAFLETELLPARDA